MTYDLETLIALNEEQCSKTVNGRCESLRCIRRGDNGNPTCEPLETAAALKELQRVTSYASTGYAIAAPKVKPLEWRNSYGVLRAETAFGDYIVTGKILRIGPMSCEMVSDDPKAAAQADYERRILSALTQETKT